jgi:nucleotide-binding universal stress UspA family protein
VTPASVFGKIVCGVDGTPAGLEAVEQAQRLAPPDAELTLVSVSESHLAVHAGPFAPQSAERLDEEAQSALDEARKLVGEAETVVLRGRAADMFVRTLRDRDATLAAVGSHEISRAAGLLIGSVATRALHEAPCSVLVARASEGPWPRAIVVGMDGSEGSFAAATVAHDIATRLGASVQFLVARGAAPDDLATEALATSGYEVTVSDDKPVPALLDAGRESDLLIVGSRGVTGLCALGSVSERVAHHAPCSLLVVRGPLTASSHERPYPAGRS